MENPLISVFVTSNWILGLLAAYIVLILFLGFKYSSKIHESDDLALAGRNLTLPFMVPSIVATWICAGAIMGAAGEAYLFGLQGVVFDPFGPVLMMFIVAVFFAFRLRRAGYSTVVDFFNKRYNPRMGMLYMIIQVIAATGWLGGQLVALGIIVNLTTGFNMTIATVIATIVVTLVTYFGGLWALSRVDAIGFILIVMGLLVMFPVVMGEVGGFSNFLATAENWGELPTFAIFPVAADDGGYLWYAGLLAIMYYIAAWASLGIGDINSQVLLQRVLAAKDEKTAVRGFAISGVLYLVLGLIPVSIGIAMFTYGLELPLDQTEMVLPWVADYMMSPVAGTIFIVALAAAIISTVGDNCLIVSTLIGHNLYEHLKPGVTKKDKLKAMRIAIPIVAIVAMLIALMFGAVYKLIVFSGAVSLATIVAPYVVGFFWKKANSKGAIASFFGGLTTWAVSFALLLPFTKEANFEEELIEAGVAMDWAIWDALYMALVPAAIVGFVLIFAVSLKTQSSDPPKPFVNAKGELMDDKLFFWSKDKKIEKA
ncbi:transporter, SSS family [Natronincola peptidivorans]|uniref:Transporter, SSS family n=1 Tax=Natronincola peptidivorans TaxID=426128 RepID=A0A1I0D6J3_9FIRM|nr:hypothetical protein [Natronincola peptidivorans]SET27821.1 transporter, SSS family [Natronincola peptidivorans]